MNQKLNILHLEDDALDAELIHSLLSQHRIDCEMQRVDTRPNFVAALEQGGFDMILSDFSLPSFNGLAALTLARSRLPGVPFLFVSGTIGEELAIESLKSGATDYVLKTRLSRLVPAVRRALAEKQTEDAMIQSEHKYRLLFEGLGSAAFLIESHNGRVLDANRQTEILLGRTRGEIIGMNHGQFMSPSTVQEFKWRFAEPINDPGRTSFEGALLRNDGRPVPVEITATPIMLYEHRVILGLCSEIGGRQLADTESRKVLGDMERELRHRTGELVVANQELDVFFGFLNGNLRARLKDLVKSTRRSLAHQNSQFDPETDLTLGLIQTKVEQTEQLTKRLLAFTDLRAKPVKLSLVKMTALADSVFTELQQHFPGREFQFELEPLPSAQGDTDELRQVFTQLVSNAIKFTRTRTHSQIRIGAYAEDAHITYYVSDNGVGFPTEEAGKLFDAFQRLHGEQDFEGVGLGLALVQRIVQRHGGQVGAEGRENAGAVFYFSLPKQAGTSELFLWNPTHC